MALAVRVAQLDSCHEIAEAWALQSQQVAQPPTVQQVNFNFVNRQALTQLFTLVGTTFWLSLPLPKSRSKSRNRTGQQDEKSKALYRAEPGQCDGMWQDWFKNIADSGRVAGQAPNVSTVCRKSCSWNHAGSRMATSAAKQAEDRVIVLHVVHLSGRGRIRAMLSNPLA